MSKEKAVQFHTTMAPKLMNSFKKLCQDYGIPVSRGAKVLMKNSIEHSQLPGMKRQGNLRLRLLREKWTPDSIIDNLDKIVKTLFPQSEYDSRHSDPLWNHMNQQYLKIYLIYAYVQQKYDKAIVGSANDELLLQYLAAVYNDIKSSHFSYSRTVRKSNDIGTLRFVLSYENKPLCKKLDLILAEMKSLASAHTIMLGTKPMVLDALKSIFTEYVHKFSPGLLPDFPPESSMQKGIIDKASHIQSKMTPDYIFSHLQETDAAVIPDSTHGERYNFWTDVSKKYLNSALTISYIAIKVAHAEPKDMKKIPHILPGAPTDDYVTRYLTLTLIFIYAVALEPEIASLTREVLTHQHNTDDKLRHICNVSTDASNESVPYNTIKLVIEPEVKGQIKHYIKEHNIGLYKMIEHDTFKGYIHAYKKALMDYNKSFK